MSNTPSNPPVITRRFYPTLSTVLDLDDIPDALGYIKDGIVTLLDNIYYKDLQFSKSPKGDAAFYSLSIVSPKKLALEIPGTGVKIILNPDVTDSGISAFPITIEYQWKVLGHIRAIGNTDFTDPQAIFELALMVLNLSQEQALSRFIMEFVEPASAGVTPMEQFVTDINAQYSADWGSSIPAPTSSTTLSEILELIHQSSGEYGALAAFGTYILDTNPSDTLDKLKRYFASILPSDIEEYIADLLIPKFEATVTLSAGIEFPRNLLIPVYSAAGENPYDGTTGHMPYAPIPIATPVDPSNPEAPNALITAGQALFYVSTESGIGYNAELTLNTVTPLQIGNTPFVISVTNAKIDLSDETNIPEVDAEGRLVDFKGVYIESTSVTLTNAWSDTVLNVTNVGSAIITGRNLIIGTHGGFSGELELTGPAGVTTTDALYFKIPGALEIELSKFNMEFLQDVLTKTEIEGKIYLPFLTEQASTTPATIDFDLTADGSQNPLLWTLDAEITSLPSLFLPFGIRVTITDLTISFDKNGINTANGPFGLGGEIELPSYFKDPSGSVSPIITLIATVDTSTGNEIITFTGATTTFNIFGLRAQFNHFNIIIVDGNISTIEIDGMLAFGSAGSPISAEVNFAIDFDFDDQLFAIQTTDPSIFNIAGIEIKIDKFYLLLDDTGIYDPTLPGNTLPSNLIPGAGIAPSHVEGSLTLPFLKGSISGNPEPIFFDVDIHTDESFSLTAKAASGSGNLPSLNLGIIKIQFVSLSLDYKDGVLIAASGAGNIEIPEWLDSNGDPVIIGVEYSADDSGTHRLAVSASAGTLAVNIKDLEVSLTSFMIEWDQSGVTGSGIGGSISIPNPDGGDSLDLGLTVEISNDGFIVEGIAAGAVPSFTIAQTVKLGLERITVEKHDTDWCVGLGNAFIEIIKSQPPIDKILPRKILIKKLKVCSTGEVEFEAGIAWGNDSMEDVPMEQDGFELYIPIKKSDLDGIKVEGIKVVAEKKNPGLGISIELVGAGFNLGPVKASASGFGLGADFTFPAAIAESGALGPVDVGLNLELPNTFMLSIDAGPVSGGGFISWDDPRFIGAMHLKIAKFNINAICILDTKLPNGQDGFALLAMMTMEFSPGIQVGFGFSITGFGGMLGLNRTVNGDSLRDGLKEGNLDVILFPENILDRIDYLIQELDGGFPIKKGHFVIGPMIKGSWGSDALVTIEAGFIIDIPSFTILLPGVLKVALTEQQEDEGGDKESVAILDIKIAILGEINFEKKYIYIDASIFDSQILGMRIEGDMAFRLRWGDRPTFIFSIGGFHPDFEIPQGLQLQRMNRMSIVIINKPKFQILAETYFAITSNTVQLGLGAKIIIDLVIFGVEAGLTFDTIFYFKPFRFQVSITAHGAILIGGVPLISFGASIELMGPSPWEFKGEAYVEIPVIGEQKVDFHVVKDNRSLAEIPSIVLLPELRKALTTATNWEAQLTPGKYDHIILRKTTDADAASIMVHPISQFQVSQKIIPFNFKMKKFGDLRIEGPDRFEVNKVIVNGEELEMQYAKDFFAPLQFRTETNAEVAVELPSFEKYDSGIKVSSPKITCGNLRTKNVEYEVKIIDQLLTWNSTSDANSTTNANQVGDYRFTKELNHGSNRKSNLSSQLAENHPNDDKRVQWKETQYYIIDKHTRIPVDLVKLSYQESMDKLSSLIAANPAIAEVYIVIESSQIPQTITPTLVTEKPLTPYEAIIKTLVI